MKYAYSLFLCICYDVLGAVKMAVHFRAEFVLTMD